MSAVTSCLNLAHKPSQQLLTTTGIACRRSWVAWRGSRARHRSCARHRSRVAAAAGDDGCRGALHRSPCLLQLVGVGYVVQVVVRIHHALQRQAHQAPGQQILVALSVANAEGQRLRIATMHQAPLPAERSIMADACRACPSSCATMGVLSWKKTGTMSSFLIGGSLSCSAQVPPGNGMLAAENKDFFCLWHKVHVSAGSLHGVFATGPSTLARVVPGKSFLGCT